MVTTISPTFLSWKSQINIAVLHQKGMEEYLCTGLYTLGGVPSPLEARGRQVSTSLTLSLIC